MEFVGIDYGSKLAGTTAIAFRSNDKIEVIQSEKKQDADAFIVRFIKLHRPPIVFIDAPLSLPGAYFGNSEDFFYRQCDRELSAMSPMFLGGLTARAMKLKASFTRDEIDFRETYPGYLAKKLDLSKLGYKKEIESLRMITSTLKEMTKLEINALTSWHQVDAVLALFAAIRFKKSEGEIFGNSEEGLIYV